MTTKHPYFEFEEGIIEIDEFDCASIFLIIGSERALVIDTGIGIGNIRALIEKLTDKPYDVVLTHGHGDHIGGCEAFDTIYMNPKDVGLFAFPEPLEGRRSYAKLIAEREHKHYSYDTEKDIVECKNLPAILPISDKQIFDLGSRIVTAYECPGHTPGEMVFIDDKSRVLFAGDACNNNLGISNRPGPAYVGFERSRDALERILAMSGSSFDPAKVYNSHHDYRGLGSPLAPDVLPDAFSCVKSLASGSAVLKDLPDPLDPSGKRMRRVAVCGNTMVSFM